MIGHGGRRRVAESQEGTDVLHCNLDRTGMLHQLCYIYDQRRDVIRCSVLSPIPSEILGAFDYMT